MSFLFCPHFLVGFYCIMNQPLSSLTESADLLKHVIKNEEKIDRLRGHHENMKTTS